MERESKAKTYLIKILIGGIAVTIAEFLLPGIQLDSVMTGFILAAVIILINLTVKPLFVLLTLPITVLTLGLFLLVINALVILACDWLIPGFSVDGFWWALLFALVLSILNGLFGNSLDSAQQ